eukprot:s1759_g6.t1
MPKVTSNLLRIEEQEPCELTTGGKASRSQTPTRGQRLPVSTLDAQSHVIRSLCGRSYGELVSAGACLRVSSQLAVRSVRSQCPRTATIDTATCFVV